MSSDIYSKPDLSHKVRYSRKAEDIGEWADTCIYESADDIDHAESQLEEEGQQSQNQPVVKKQAVRGATLCKVVICIVVLAGLLLLGLYLTIKLNKMSQQLEEIFNGVQQLKNRSEGKWCPDRWTRFGSSCYFRSTETKSWFDSREDCQERGADLVIIDTEEEQKFVAHLSGNVESWIGLRSTKVTTGQPYKWRWVDGSLLKTGFWESEPTVNWYYATCCSTEGKWKKEYYTYSKNWICEK